jgi:hypothetical protein
LKDEFNGHQVSVGRKQKGGFSVLINSPDLHVCQTASDDVAGMVNVMRRKKRAT